MKIAVVLFMILMPLVCRGEVYIPVECSERSLTSPSSSTKSTWDAITNPRDVEKCIKALVSGINSDKKKVSDEASLHQVVDNLLKRVERLEAEMLMLKNKEHGK